VDIAQKAVLEDGFVPRAACKARLAKNVLDCESALGFGERDAGGFAAVDAGVVADHVEIGVSVSVAEDGRSVIRVGPVERRSESERVTRPVGHVSHDPGECRQRSKPQRSRRADPNRRDSVPVELVASDG